MGEGGLLRDFNLFNKLKVYRCIDDEFDTDSLIMQRHSTFIVLITSEKGFRLPAAFTKALKCEH